MKTKGLPPNVPLMLAQAREMMILPFRPILKHFGLTEQQWRILRVLRQRAPMEPREICVTCLFESSNISGVLLRMEALDLVRKAPHPSDQRRVLIFMTDKSEALVETMTPLIERQYRLFEEVIGAEQMSALVAILEKFLTLKPLDVPAVKLPEE